MSLILIPIAFCKRLNRLNEKSWIIMPLAILFFILIYIGKRYFPQWVGSYDFYVALEFGCIFAFFYSLVQNSIYIIRKVLKE
jgi:xanthine/uracil permease